jgi:hypothetical protein
VTVPIQFLFTKCTGTTGNIEWHEDMVAYFQVLNIGANFFDNTGKLMPKGHTHPGIGHKTMI